MNPITDETTAMGASTRKPELTAVSDIVKSPTVDTTVDTKVKFGLVEENAPMLPVTEAAHKGQADSHLRDLIENEISILNSELGQKRISLSFSIDDDSGSLVVQVVESESGRVIRQIPPDEILTLRKRLEELTGIIFDAKV